MTHVITAPCCSDARCVEVCPVDCIHPRPDSPGHRLSEMLYIDPKACVDCGACVEVCPVDAIIPDHELPAELAEFAEINAHFFQGAPNEQHPPKLFEANRRVVRVLSATAPLRVAIVGSGPAAMYVAEELLESSGLDVEVHVFERLPTPWGLVRSGVAPDHQHTKSVARVFQQTASRSDIVFHFNVEVGTHITHEELLAHHHAVIYAVGAAADRHLGIPGERMPGSHSATDFVAWYNGHPDHADGSFDLSSPRALVVGNGNVALDVARILLSDVGQLSRTDIADHALAALAKSRISEVVVLGRRGPAQAAYTLAELIGLTQTPGLDVVVDRRGLPLAELSRIADATAPHSVERLKVELVRSLAQQPRQHERRIVLRYLASPVHVLGAGQVTGLRVVRNELLPAEDGKDRVRSTSVEEDISCGLVLRSIGHRGTSILGLPFDDLTGTLPNDGGRVVDAGGGSAIPGAYAVGWIKRGPSGAIGTNRECAKETVSALLDDYLNDRLEPPSMDRSALDRLLSARQPQALGLDGWMAIDAFERALGRDHQRPRVKVTDVGKMVDIARRSAAAPADAAPAASVSVDHRRL